MAFAYFSAVVVQPPTISQRFFFHFRSLWTHVGASMRLRLLPLLLLAGPAFMLKPLHSLTTTLNLRPVTWPVPGSGWLEDGRVERKYVVYVI